MLKTVILCVILVGLCNVQTTHAFINRLMNQVQKQWMESWQRMRDQQVRPRRIAEMYLNFKPTYIQTIDSINGKLDLAINGLDASDRSYTVYRAQNLSEWLKGEQNFSVYPLAERLGEINSIGKIDDESLAQNGVKYWWSASNFYPFQGVEGIIAFIPVENLSNATQIPLIITSDEDLSQWYYSMVQWVDMNEDGWPDIVTSRSRGMPGAIQYSELVWLENPGYSFFFQSSQRHWRLRRITHGPDVSIQVLRIPLPSGQSRLVIIGAGYWDNKLYAVWTEDPEEDWTNLDAINERVIDNHGWFFDLKIADVNADGRVDIVASTWSNDKKQGSVYVYEIPCDFTHGKWRRHTLIDGTVELNQQPDTGSGAKITVFHPYLRYGQTTHEKKPFILVSNDNEGRIYVMIPNSRKTNDWQYTSHTIYKTRGPVGEVAVDDINHDGFMEVLVPVKEQRKIVYFSYEPGPIGPEYFVDETQN